MIQTLQELAAHLGSNDPEHIARILYKATECGISYWVAPDGSHVVVGGYCEGVDYECTPVALHFPFASEVFDGAVELADAEGCALWNATHGCPDCPPSAEYDGYRTTNPECETCEGAGQII